MKFLKVVVIPFVILGVVLLATLAVYSDLPYSGRIMLAPLLAELSLLVYFWKYKLSKDTKAGLFHLYMTFLVLLVFTVKLIATFLYSNGTIPWTPYSYIYYAFVGVVFVAGLILKALYGGTNKSIGMQFRGETNLGKMKELCKDIISELEKSRHETIKQIRIMKQILEEIEYSDPVTHKKVIPVEKSIIKDLETILKHAQNKLFSKVKEIAKGSSGILYKLEERNKQIKYLK